MNEFEKAKEAYEQIPIPEELEERVQAGIRQGREARRSAKRQRSWKRSVGAVAACFVVMVGMLNVSPTVAAAAADVPVLGGLFQVLTVRSFIDETEDRTLEVKQPGVTGGELAEQVNAEIQERVDAKIAEGEQLIAAGPAGDLGDAPEESGLEAGKRPVSAQPDRRRTLGEENAAGELEGPL